MGLLSSTLVLQTKIGTDEEKRDSPSSSYACMGFRILIHCGISDTSRLNQLLRHMTMHTACPLPYPAHTPCVFGFIPQKYIKCCRVADEIAGLQVKTGWHRTPKAPDDTVLIRTHLLRDNESQPAVRCGAVVVRVDCVKAPISSCDNPSGMVRYVPCE